MKLSDKHRLKKGSSPGSTEKIFDILKKDLSKGKAEGNKKEEWRKTKIKFIENCASSDLKKEFRLTKSTKNNEKDKLVFADEDLFWEWFLSFKTTKWDEAILKELDENKNINFDITLPNNDSKTFNEDSDFPDLEKVTGSSETEIQVSIDSKKNPSLSEINGNNDWTWECVVSFFKDEGIENKELKEKKIR